MVRLSPMHIPVHRPSATDRASRSTVVPRIVDLPLADIVSLGPPESSWLPDDWDRPDRPLVRTLAAAWMVRRMNQEIGFYEHLAEEIRTNGQPWPILVSWPEPMRTVLDAVPPEMRASLRRRVRGWCEGFGCRDLFVLRRLDRPTVRCIVNDRSTRWHSHPVVKAPSDVHDLFRWPPAAVVFDRHGVRILPPAEYELAGRKFRESVVSRVEARILAEIREIVASGRTDELRSQTA